MTRLIVDSTCDMNDELKSRYDFDIIPLSIILDDQAYLDGVEIDTAKVYEYMKNGGIPKTSQISYGSLISVLDKCVENKEDFIYLTFSSKMSGTYNLAYGVIEEYKEKYPELKMEIIDSEGGSGGASLIAIQTLRMIEKNVSFENLVQNISFMKEHIHYHFTLPNIEWLAKGGRVNKGVGYIGDKLDLKPYLTVIDGKIELQKVVMGRKKSLKTLIDDTLAYVGDFKKQLIVISHADDMEAAKFLEEKLKKALPESEVIINSIGSVLGVHIGLGGIGVFALDQKPEHYQFD